MIRAEVHTDDYNLQVPFDATAWFEQASNEAIIALKEIEWRGDDAADAVAQHFEELIPAIGKLFEYLAIIQDDWSKKDCCGFECSVEEDDALAWLAKYRPELHQRLTEEVPNDPGRSIEP